MVSVRMFLRMLVECYSGYFVDDGDEANHNTLIINIKSILYMA